LQDDLEESQNIVSASSHKYKQILRADVAQLHKDIASLQSEVASFMQLGDIKQFDDRCIAAARLQRLLGECAAPFTGADCIPCCVLSVCSVAHINAPQFSGTGWEQHKLDLLPFVAQSWCPLWREDFPAAMGTNLL
jgi:hypothetical protein